MLSLLPLLALAAGPPAAADPPLPPGAVARLGPTLFRVGPYARLAAVAPDGRTVTHLVDSTTLAVRDVATGRVLRTTKLKQHVNGNALSFTPDGKRLAVAEYYALVFLDPATGEPVGRLALNDNRGGMRFNRLRDSGLMDGQFGLSADGSRAAFGSRYQNGNSPPGAVVLDTAAGTVVADVTVVHQSNVHAVLSLDGRRMATFGQHYARVPNEEPLAGVVQVWDVGTGAELARVRTGTAQVTAAAFSPDGRRLYTGGTNGPVQGWELPVAPPAAPPPAAAAAPAAAPGPPAPPVPPGMQPTLVPPIAPERLLAAPVAHFPTRAGVGQRLFVAPDGSRLAAASQDGTVQVWETATGRTLGTAGLQVDRVPEVAFPPGGPAVAVGGYAHTLQVWTVPGGPVTPQGGHLGPVTDIRFAAGGRELVTVGQEGRVVRWGRDGRELASFGSAPTARRRWAAGGTVYSTHAARLAPDARTLLTAGNGGIPLLDLDTGSERHTLFFPGVQSVSVGRPPSLSADGRRAAAAGQYYANNRQGVFAAAWDTDTGRPLAVVRADNDPNAGVWVQGSAAEVGPDGRWLAAAALTRRNTRTGRPST